MTIPQDKYQDFLDTLLLCANWQEVHSKINEFLSIPLVKEYKLDKATVIQDFEEVFRSYVKKQLTGGNKKPSVLLNESLMTDIKRFITDKTSRMKFIESCLYDGVDKTILGLSEIITIAKTKKNESNFLIKGLIPSPGFFLLTAPPKKGKTKVINYMMSSIALGLKCFNYDVRQVNTLIVQNDMGISQACLDLYKNRLMKLELEDPLLYNSAIANDSMQLVKDVDIVLDREWLFEYAKENNRGLIIIDALVSSIVKSGLSEMNSEIAPHLYDIHRLSHEYEITTILLHHTNKAALGKDYNPNNVDNAQLAISGTNAIYRTIDGGITASTNKENNAHMDLTFNMARSYGLSALTVKYIEGEANHWTWEVVNDNTFSKKDIDLICDILELLYDRWEEWQADCVDHCLDNETPLPDELKNPYGYTLNELDRILTKYDRDVIMAKLNWMLPEKYGAIEHYKQDNNWVYCITASGECIFKQYILERQEAVAKAEMQRSADMLAKDKLKELILTYPNTDLAAKGIALSEFKDQFQSDAESWSRVKALLKEDNEKLHQELFIALSYWSDTHPTPFNLGSHVKFIDDAIDGVYEIIDLSWDYKSKKVQTDRVMYKLQNVETLDELSDWYRTFQLQLVDNSDGSEVDAETVELSSENHQTSQSDQESTSETRIDF